MKFILCWLLGYWRHDPMRGHKWRRLHKKETPTVLSGTIEGAQVRICDRCSAIRIAKQRKPKEQPA